MKHSNRAVYTVYTVQCTAHYYWGHERAIKNWPNRFNYFDVYWTQTDEQTPQ